MALSRCKLARHENLLSEFQGKTYITTGLNIIQSRVTIDDGGYCLDDGYCYLKIKLTSKYNFSASQALIGLPASTSAASVITSANEIDMSPQLIADNILTEYPAYIYNYSGTRPLSFAYFPSGTQLWIYSKYPV